MWGSSRITIYDIHIKYPFSSPQRHAKKEPGDVIAYFPYKYASLYKFMMKTFPGLVSELNVQKMTLIYIRELESLEITQTKWFFLLNIHKLTEHFNFADLKLQF